MPGEVNPHQVVDFALVPVSGRPDVGNAGTLGHLSGAAPSQGHFHSNAMVLRDRIQLVDSSEAGLDPQVPSVLAGQIHQQVVLQFRIITQEARDLEQRVAAKADNSIAAELSHILYRVWELGFQLLYG